MTADIGLFPGEGTYAPLEIYIKHIRFQIPGAHVPLARFYRTGYQSLVDICLAVSQQIDQTKNYKYPSFKSVLRPGQRLQRERPTLLFNENSYYITDYGDAIKSINCSTEPSSY